MQIRENHYHLDQIQTVGDVLSRGAEIAKDVEGYQNIPAPAILEILTQIAYPHGAVAGTGLSGITTDPQYREHLRIRRMDLEVQGYLKAHGCNLFRDARHSRKAAGEILQGAADTWAEENKVA